MNKAGLEPTSETYVTLMCCLAKHGLVDEIFSTLTDCESNNILILDRDLLEIVYHLAMNSHTDKIYEILESAQKSQGFNQDCINVILRLISRGKEDIAYEIFKVMPRTLNNNGEVTDNGNFFIRQLLKASTQVSKIVDICTDMKSNNFNSRSFEVAYEAGTTLNIFDLIKLLHEMKKNSIDIRQHYFWPVFCRANNKSEIIHILTEMKDNFGIEPNTDTLRDFIIPNLKEFNPTLIINHLTKSGISRGVAAVATAHWTLSSNRFEETVAIMENHKAVYPTSIFKNQIVSGIMKSENVELFVKYLNAACLNLKSKQEAKQIVSEATEEAVAQLKPQQYQQIENILSKLLENKLGIYNECAEKIQNKLESVMNETISNLLSQLTSIDSKPTRGKILKFEQMSIDEIEEYIANNRYPYKTNFLKRCLINAYLKTKNIPSIENIMQKMQQSGFNIPLGQQAQWIDIYCSADKLDDALTLYSELKIKNPDFQLDRIKTLKMADLILKKGNTDKAIDLLVENKKEELNVNDETLFSCNNAAWKLLSNLSETGNPELTKNIFYVLEANNYIKPSNVVLGPLIKVYLKTDNLSGAMEAFAEICEKYQATPWKNELCCRLIQNEDAANLQKLTDLSTSIHGEVNSLYDLVFSFIECGRIAQARKILKTPGLQNRSNRINSACERYRNGGDTKSLEGLVEATTNINYIDRNLIFFNLLQRYQKENDPQKALNLWTKMQEENIVPTETFLTRLSMFLRENNIKVPFSYPAENSKSKPSEKKDLLKILEKSLKENNLTEALETMREVVTQKTNVPYRILKFYINKFASNGDYKIIEELVLSDDIKKKISYDNRLCHAYIKAAKVKEYYSKLKADLDSCVSADEIKKQGSAFPRGGALGILENFPDMYEECKLYRFYIWYCNIPH